MDKLPPPPVAWLLKAVLALCALGGLAALAASSLAPGLPLWRAVLFGVGGALGVAGVVALAAVVLARTGQWVLRLGGTDTQWLGLPGDPPGLKRPPRDRQP